MLVPELFRDLEVEDVRAKSDVVSYVELHDFSLSLVEGLKLVLVAIPFPHQHIYYTINRCLLHVFDRLFAIILCI